MYLIERVTSLCIFILVLFIMLLLIIKTKSKRTIKRILLLYLVILIIMGYFYVPHSGADLTRLIIRMKYYSNFEVSTFLNRCLQSSTPAEPIYYYIIGHLRNDRLLPTITALITFSFCLCIYRNILKYDSEVNKWDIAISLMVFMSRGLTLQIMSNIRTTMALSIISWCIYMEFYRNKKIQTLLFFYMIAFFLHTMGQVMVLYRLGYIFLEKRGSKKTRIMKIIAVMVILYILVVKGQKYFTGIIRKINSYWLSATSGIGYYNYVWERVLTFFALIICIYSIIYFRKILKKEKKNLRNKNLENTKKLVSFIIPLIFLDIISSFIEFSFFQRIGWFLTILGIPLIVYVSELGRIYNGKKNFKFQKRIIILSFIMLILACIRGDLCSLKFFIL